MSEADAAACAHDGCGCEAPRGSNWCSEQCREAQQGYAAMPRTMCNCNHPECRNASAPGA